jgi:hypothetical protein
VGTASLKKSGGTTATASKSLNDPLTGSGASFGGSSKWRKICRDIQRTEEATRVLRPQGYAVRDSTAIKEARRPGTGGAVRLPRRLFRHPFLSPKVCALLLAGDGST